MGHYPEMFMDQFVTAALIELASTGAVLIDGIVVSRTLSPDAMAAFGISYPFFTITAVFFGMFASGMQTMISHEMGNGNIDACNRIFCATIYIAGIFSIISMAFSFVAAGGIAYLQGGKYGSVSLLEGAASYIRGLSFGVPPIILCAVLAPAIRMDSGKVTDHDIQEGTGEGTEDTGTGSGDKTDTGSEEGSEGEDNAEETDPSKTAQKNRVKNDTDSEGSSDLLEELDPDADTVTKKIPNLMLKGTANEEPEGNDSQTFSYIDKNETIHTLEDNEYSILTSSSYEIGANGQSSFVAVQGSVTINGQLTVHGLVNIILRDVATLNCKGLIVPEALQAPWRNFLRGEIKAALQEEPIEVFDDDNGSDSVILSSTVVTDD